MKSIIRCLFGLGALLLVLSGCATSGHPNADQATIAAVSYRDPGPKFMRLYTMVNNRSGSGAHTGLVISASETILFDPAGSFYAKTIPERNDVLFGISPRVEAVYKGAHARSTYHVVIQTIPLSAEQAEVAYRLALNNGAVGQAFCANSTSELISKIPGFEAINTTFYPNNLSKQIGALPGITTEKYYEDDSDDLAIGLAAGDAILSE